VPDGSVVPHFGVVVLTMGQRPEDLRRGLESVLAQEGVTTDVVVVGNGWVPVDLPDGVRGHALPENVGIPAGRNAGVPEVSGELIFFLDDDAALASPDTLVRFAALFTARPEVGLIQPRVEDPSGRPAPGRWVPRLRTGMPLFTEHIKLDGRIYFFENSTLGRNDKLTLIPFDLGVQVHLMPGAELNPYALGGLSFIYADDDRTDVDSSFGGYLGGGLEWTPFSIIKLYGEMMYRFQELEGGRGDNIDVSGMTGNVGVKIYF
jgi:glycosyltransferase involved in cell wall biosynthesis